MNHIVILGGGYGGLTTAVELLEGDIPLDCSLTLVDRMPYQGLKTEYYALASGSVADIELRVAFPEDRRLTVRYGNVTDINLAERTIELDGEESEKIPYSHLVIALGCTDKYHGIPGADLYTNSIQSFSAARQTYASVNSAKPYGTISIVGGGLSGVEMAAELRETRKDLNIKIIDRGESVLSPFPEKLKSYVREWFEENDVEMVSSASVSRVEPGVLFNRDMPIYTDSIVWTAGIQPSPIVQKLDVPKDPQGRVLLNAYHQIPDWPEVYVVGDCASLPFSPSGQAAEAQGKQVAQVIRALWKGEAPKLERIKLKGVLGSLGKKAGFGVMGKRTVMIGRVPRMLKSGVLWMSRHHFG